MSSFVKRHEVLFFFTCTYMLTGLFFVFQLWVLPDFAFPLFLLSPAIMSIVTIGILSGRPGMMLFLKGLLPRTKMIWIVVSLILPALLMLLITIMNKVITAQPITPFTNTDAWMIGLVPIALIGSIGEEIGWRGYLLPLIARKHNRLLSGILVGLLWALWHTGDYGQGLGFLLQVIWITELSVIYTWLYYKANKNLIVPILYHTIHGICGTYAGFAVMNIWHHVAFILVYAVLAIILIVTSSVYNVKDEKNQ